MWKSQVLLSKSHDFQAVFALAHSKINKIAEFFVEIIQEGKLGGVLKVSITSF